MTKYRGAGGPMAVWLALLLPAGWHAQLGQITDFQAVPLGPAQAGQKIEFRWTAGEDPYFGGTFAGKYHAGYANVPIDDGNFWNFPAVTPIPDFNLLQPQDPGMEEVLVVTLPISSTGRYHFAIRSESWWVYGFCSPTSPNAVLDFDFDPPSAVDTLAVISVSGNLATLEWKAPDDWTAAGKGVAAVYDIRISDQPILNGLDFQKAKIVPAKTAPSAAGFVEAVAANLIGAATVHFAVKAGDLAGNWSDVSNSVTADMPVAEDPGRGHGGGACGGRTRTGPLSACWIAAALLAALRRL